MTPIGNPSTAAERAYNDAHRRTRTIVERTFGILKSRFRCLDITGGSLLYSPEMVCKIILTCAILHNICIKRNIPRLEPEPHMPEEEEEEDAGLQHEGELRNTAAVANMTSDQVCEFQSWAMRYQHILLVESGFKRMARRYHQEWASGAWRAFPQGRPTLPTTATTSTTTTSSQVAPSTCGSVVPTSGGLPGPSIAIGAGQPTGPGSTHTQTSSTETQTATAPSVDPAAFHNIERKMDRVLRKLSHLSGDVRHINRRVKSIKRTLRRANL
ncbi:hypothetical protein NDU88_004745 [Pleurodeles waltl]|uniref:DDE Tnp4 domain-containing protein n=1 Tax=Pleurodeles waltl TaxID=8319 RepID=A0AAV7MW09_PLEWA|nr:hypothetical protein NDU88_004745 [Pleurodeles waltl]